MIIRESPTSNRSNLDTNWPPKSPHEVLLSSPSRLKRLQRTADRDLSSTPTKRARHDLVTPIESAEEGDDVEDDDEETLQLQLKAIEARLKLKKLQKTKRKILLRGESVQNVDKTQVEGKILVVHSPKPHRQAQQAPKSPKRVLLGIDKGLKASDVSLKRAYCADTKLNLFSETKRNVPVKAAKTFSERLRDSRVDTQTREAKEERGKLLRSKGFSAGVIRNDQTLGHCDTRALSVKVAEKSQLPGYFKNDSTVDQGKIVAESSLENQGQGLPVSKAYEIVDNFKENSYRTTSNKDADPYSGFRISKRLIDEATLAASVAGKTVVSIPKLLKDITSPNFDIPDFPTDDFVVLGIIASKSSPKECASTHSTSSSTDADSNANAKFMALTLTDLQWSLDLFLFDTGFSRFWKLSVGTVIAILNPGIMPPKPHLRDTGRFSLKLSSSEDTVLELGTAQDLGFCKSLKRDGKECGQWIDNRKTEYCDFHVNLAIEKTTAGRMEINGMTGIGLFGMGGESRSNKRGGRNGLDGAWRGSSRAAKTTLFGSKQQNNNHNRHLNEFAYNIPPEFSTARSAANLLDSEDYVQGALSAKERSRKRLADHEKERELSRKLASAGNGMGLEYLRVKGRAGDGDKGGTGEKGRRDEEKEGKLDANELGLVGSSAADVKLSPVRVLGRKRNEDIMSQPMGWGGAFKRDLPTRKERRAENQDSAPVNTNKPITAPTTTNIARSGSAVGVPKPSRVATYDDDDDDDLDII